jgi:hypothetical protein
LNQGTVRIMGPRGIRLDVKDSVIEQRVIE